MENEKDVFSQGWSGPEAAPDDRPAEPLPAEDAPGAGESGPEAAPETGDPAAERDLEGEFARFVRAFPQVRGQDIPGEVWERVRAGQSLTEAYLMSERERLREENGRLRADRDRRALNASRAAGSQSGEGSGAIRLDAFDEGWDIR